MDIKLIKQHSKKALNANYLNALGFICILGLISLIIEGIGSMIPIVNILIAIFLSSFVSMANAKYTKSLYQTKQKIKYMDCIPKPIPALKLFCVNFMFSLLTFIVLIIPLSLALVGNMIVGLILTLVVLIFVVIFITPAAMISPFFLLDNEEMSIIEVFAKSIKMYFGNSGKFILMCLSFILWFILCVITFGIASLYVGPYLNLAIYGAYYELSGQSKNEYTIDDIDSNDSDFTI